MAFSFSSSSSFIVRVIVMHGFCAGVDGTQGPVTATLEGSHATVEKPQAQATNEVVPRRIQIEVFGRKFELMSVSSGEWVHARHIGMRNVPG